MEKMRDRDRLYDDLYLELCVLQSCALGTCFAAEHRLDALYEDLKTGLIVEFGKVMELYEKLNETR